MNGKFTFTIENEDRTRDLPRKILIGQNPTETTAHVLLKFLAFILFHRERVQMEARLHDDNIPFTPDVVQLDYELRPRLWVECGECSVAKLDKLAVKVPEAELWVVKRSPVEMEQLRRAMKKGELREQRYNLLAFDASMFDEMLELLKTRNQLFWLRGDFESKQLQFEFNGLWFDCEFALAIH